MPVVSTLYFLFRLLTMIFHSVRRVGFHLYMAVSTLQLTLSEIFLNTGSFFSSIPAVAGVSSVSTYYSLIQRWNPVLPLSPERHPYSSFNFQCSTIKSFVGIHFCTYFDLMPLYPQLLLMSIALHVF